MTPGTGSGHEQGGPRLVLLRHAKSAWPEGVEDHERPLAPRGRSDAAEAGRLLREMDCVPDLVVCSPSRRTRETWDLVAAPLGGAQLPVTYDERVYAAEPDELITVLREVPPETGTVLLVGHNPGIEELSAALSGDADLDSLAWMTEKFPTSAFAVFALGTGWAALVPGAARLVSFVVARASTD
ncbi:histidine phosphatase family protein [Streptomyces sp. NPDC019396]|uniref:SixA phosphatase family protein n=1 Tax=Streptomyces sp. NPDC019396 TaxID=3154687 RepID=UPI0033CDC695